MLESRNAGCAVALGPRVGTQGCSAALCLRVETGDSLTAQWLRVVIGGCTPALSGGGDRGLSEEAGQQSEHSHAVSVSASCDNCNDNIPHC